MASGRGVEAGVKLLVVDLYGDGDVLRVVEDTPKNRKLIQEWDQFDPMDFSSWSREKGIAEVPFEVMRLRSV